MAWAPEEQNRRNRTVYRCLIYTCQIAPIKILKIVVFECFFSLLELCISPALINIHDPLWILIYAHIHIGAIWQVCRTNRYWIVIKQYSHSWCLFRKHASRLLTEKASRWPDIMESPRLLNEQHTLWWCLFRKALINRICITDKLRQPGKRSFTE